MTLQAVPQDLPAFEIPCTFLFAAVPPPAAAQFKA
jgi:hypothetical protein